MVYSHYMILISYNDRVTVAGLFHVKKILDLFLYVQMIFFAFNFSIFKISDLLLKMSNSFIKKNKKYFI